MRRAGKLRQALVLAAATLAVAIAIPLGPGGNDAFAGDCDTACATRRRDCDAGCFKQQQDCALACGVAGPNGMERCLAECAARSVHCGAVCVAQDEACKLACRVPPPPQPPAPGPKPR